MSNITPYLDQINSPLPIRQRRAIIDNDTFKALPTTPYELFTPIGPNRMLILLSGILLLDQSAAAYTNENGSAYIQLVTTDSDTYISDRVSGLITAGDDNPYCVLKPFATPDFSIDYTVNHGIWLMSDNGGDGDYTGGDPLNTLTISVVYLILNTLTGLFE